ncbi:MAG: hypothetical protein M3495_05750, partial [Pseudomonadota bacterium]|nr:hypothetical protein [Pseudomonadota bacterium]
RLPGDIRRLARPGGAAQLLSSLLILLKGWISPVVMSSATLQTPATLSSTPFPDDPHGSLCN